jgi:hypothetical protein
VVALGFILLAIGVLYLTRRTVTTVLQKVLLDDAVYRLATAMAKFETGVRSPGPFPLNPSLWQGFAARNNNPGNLVYAGQRGAILGEGGFAKFASPVDGWNALLAEVRNDITKPAAFAGDAPGPTGTLLQFIQAFSKTDQAAYAAFVSGEIGISMVTRFTEWVDYGFQV